MLFEGFKSRFFPRRYKISFHDEIRNVFLNKHTVARYCERARFHVDKEGKKEIFFRKLF